MRHLSAAALAVLTLSACTDLPHARPSAQRQALGEPVDGFPDWAERVVHVWTNRARADPATELADCSACAEADCYGPVPPLVWDHNLGRAARFHSANLTLAGCNLQHDSPCTLVSDIGDAYLPGPCDGAPSCACTGGSAQCGSVGTTWSTRIGYFGSGARAENIAGGGADPLGPFYMWLYESDSNPACGWRDSNGHRANILGGSSSLGVGRAGSIYTQDFGGASVPQGIVGGVHYPRSGADVAFRANWYGAQGPLTAQVSIEGDCHPMALERGVETNGTYLATLTGLATTCQRYVFHFRDQSGADVFHPSTGGYTINCPDDFDPARPAPCGPCDPTCDGRACGDDGCGGSCGACSDGLSCVDYQCTCLGAQCGGVCVDTDTDPAHCGGCDQPCDAGELCAGGTCVCLPDCSGRACGDDGCGGSCGACAADRSCDTSGQCVCTVGTDCEGSCVDTTRDRANCGVCGTKCKGNTKWCVDGTCQRDCVLDCTDRACGDDGCGDPCGTCGEGLLCSAVGQCVCPSGEADCGSGCIDILSDPQNCGGCGIPCDQDEQCIWGVCGGTRPDAGAPDSATPPDAASTTDSGAPGDSAAGVDSGADAAAVEPDAAVTPDAALTPDAAVAADTGQPVDSAVVGDGAPPVPDAAVVEDAGAAAEDGGADAAAAEPDAGRDSVGAGVHGCACGAAAAGHAGLAWPLLLVCVLLSARRVRGW